MEPSSAFRDKPAAGLEVVNGFGKAAGLSQIAELGFLETPLALRNTLGVGAAFEGLAPAFAGRAPRDRCRCRTAPNLRSL
ncbi:P1 family peptidase [Streptomyces sp. NPDC056512]|uniref:P1 family peptidase n=1 Tax=Streptomyces sp. NPDC056512 TaxID=3345846 RepID=UPI003683168B